MDSIQHPSGRQVRSPLMLGALSLLLAAALIGCGLGGPRNPPPGPPTIAPVQAQPAQPQPAQGQAQPGAASTAVAPAPPPGATATALVSDPDSDQVNSLLDQLDQENNNADQLTDEP